jgi:hypothetical protein
MTEENWKPVVGYEGYYEVSDLGNIRSVRRTLQRGFKGGVTSNIAYESKILKPMSTKFDYLKYGLSKDGKTKSFTGHRIVALSWLPNPENLPQVHHKDHNKHNNAVSNLEWVTASKNVKEAIKAGKHHGGFKTGVNHHSGKFTDTQIGWMRKLKADGYSLTELSEIFQTSRGTLSPIINLKRRVVDSISRGELIFCKRVPVLAVTPA